jgi:hypothetical protein
VKRCLRSDGIATGYAFSFARLPHLRVPHCRLTFTWLHTCCLHTDSPHHSHALLSRTLPCLFGWTSFCCHCLTCVATIHGRSASHITYVVYLYTWRLSSHTLLFAETVAGRTAPRTAAAPPRTRTPHLPRLHAGSRTWERRQALCRCFIPRWAVEPPLPRE